MNIVLVIRMPGKLKETRQVGRLGQAKESPRERP